MTPLARKIVKQLTLPIKQRTIIDKVGLLKRMDDIHCFDVTDVVHLALSLQDQIAKGGIDERSTFLPAPKTWIEWSQASSEFGAVSGLHRGGFLLIEDDNKQSARIFIGEEGNGKLLADDWEGVSHLDMKYKPLTPEELSAKTAEDDDFAKEMGWSSAQLKRWTDNKAGRTEEFIFACLALINTPRIIGRRTHVPQKTLERKILEGNPSVGKYPLLAWTEIKLEVGIPKDASGDGAYEAHLTGRRALHFCRAFIRVRLGRLEIVRSHWRGDAALGMKQSRYKLTQPVLHS